MLTQTMLSALFWMGVLVIVYTYIGYGLIAALLVRLRERRSLNAGLSPRSDFEPTVTLVVAAYNEGESIRAKLFNSLRLDYPREKLDLLFVTDGSTDETPDLVSKVAGVRHLHVPTRSGKIAAMNRAMESLIRQRPEQYLWIHRRFKDQPDGATRAYLQRSTMQRSSSPLRDE